MNLYINTSGKLCEIALLNKGLVIDQQIHQEAMQHSTVLHDMIANILKVNSLTFSDLKGIGVLNGPGSYTGLRVGLAAAKGICYASDIPLVLFNQLDLINQFYISEHATNIPVASIIPARTDEYFFAMQQKDTIICPASGYKSSEIRNFLEVENSEHVLLCPNSVMITDIPFPFETVNLSLGFISTELNRRIDNNLLDNIYSSEPFYLKKVHANTPKKLF